MKTEELLKLCFNDELYGIFTFCSNAESLLTRLQQSESVRILAEDISTRVVNEHDLLKVCNLISSRIQPGQLSLYDIHVSTLVVAASKLHKPSGTLDTLRNELASTTSVELPWSTRISKLLQKQEYDRFVSSAKAAQPSFLTENRTTTIRSAKPLLIGTEVDYGKDGVLPVIDENFMAQCKRQSSPILTTERELCHA